MPAACSDQLQTFHPERGSASGSTGTQVTPRPTAALRAAAVRGAANSSLSCEGHLLLFSASTRTSSSRELERLYYIKLALIAVAHVAKLGP